MSKNEHLERAMVESIPASAWERIRGVAGSDGSAKDVIKLDFHSTGAAGGVIMAIASALGHRDAVAEVTDGNFVFDEVDVQRMVAELHAQGVDISYSNNLDTRLQKKDIARELLSAAELDDFRQGDDYSLRIGPTPEQARHMLVAHTKVTAEKEKAPEAALLQLQPDEADMISGGLAGLEAFVSEDSNAALKESVTRGMLDEIAMALHKRGLIQTPPKQSTTVECTNRLRAQISPGTVSKLTGIVGELLDDVLLGQNDEQSEAALIQKVVECANAELALKAQQKRSEGRG